MSSQNNVGRLLVESGAFTDLDDPVILTSGELGIYCINTEKFLGDGGRWKEFGDDPREMIAHSINQYFLNGRFAEVVRSLSAIIDEVLPADKSLAISGGQRRDWIFSGATASHLGVSHISLYKNSNKVELMKFGRGSQRIECGLPLAEEVKDISQYRVYHIADLLTEGSSCYRIEDGDAKGWIPMLRERGATVEDLLAVVSRRQGAEEMLANQGVRARSLVTIDEEFIRKHSKFPERALEYMKDPGAWSATYLEQNGALDFVDAFNPDGTQIDRAKRFLKRYGTVLEQAGRMTELENDVMARFGYSIKHLREGSS